MSKVISKIKDLEGIKIDNDENYFELEYYKNMEQVRVSEGEGDIIEIFNVKLTDWEHPYPTYTLPQIVEQLRDRYGFDIEYKEELTDREIEIYKALKVLGFNWIARDNNGDILGFEKKPIKDEKEEDYFCAESRAVDLEKSDFQFITFDTGAWEIPNL